MNNKFDFLIFFIIKYKMIIIIEKNYPLIVMIIDKFEDIEYKTFLKNLDYFSKKTQDDNCCLKLYIDIYKLDDNYSLNSLNNLVNELSGKYYPTLDKIKLFVNKEKISYILKSYLNLTDYIDLIELNKKKEWR